MAFVIYKKSDKNGIQRRLYYLVENYREKGKIKRRTIIKLNDCMTLPIFHEYLQKELSFWIDRLTINKKKFDITLDKTNPLKISAENLSKLKTHYRRKVWGAEFQVKEIQKNIDIISGYL